MIVPLPFMVIGKYLGGSYGMYGVAMVVLFLLTRDIPYAKAAQLIGMVLLSLRMAGFPGHIGVQVYAIAALVPIFLYSGEKHSRNPAHQWAFTLFYPLHMILLLLIRYI